MSLEAMTTGIKEKVGDHSPIAKVVKFSFGDDGVITIDGTASPTVVDNTDKDADCTVNVSMADFEAMLGGSLNPQMAFMTGKLRIEGDMSIAMQLGSIVG